jgi:hypothetical protein
MFTDTRRVLCRYILHTKTARLHRVLRAHFRLTMGGGGVAEPHGRRKVRQRESNEKCRHQKIDLERDFVAGVYLSEAPSPPRLLFRVV